MFVWLRNGVIIFAVLCAAYAILYFRARSRQKDKLKAAYLETDRSTPQADFVATELEKYNRSFRPKLFLAVFGVPIAIIGVLIYLAYA